MAIDDRLRLVSLTPTFSCVQSASDGRDRKFLYLAFKAASVLQVHIIKDSQKLIEAQKQKLLSDPATMGIPTTTLPHHYPMISTLPVSEYATSPGTGNSNYLTFEICGLLNDNVHNCLLYKANLKRPGIDDLELILIKFARRYSIDLHSFCAKAGHAPLILGYGRLPGGWYAVAMEYVRPGTSITKSDLCTTQGDRWTEELESLVAGFHAEELVHGDLRDANIICKGDSVVLVDFDWGGKVGKVSYPTLELNPELLKGRTSDSLEITKDDDMRVLTKTLSKLK